MPASLNQIGEKLKEDEQIDLTSNEFAVKSNSVEAAKFYGIFEEIVLPFPVWLENPETDL